MYCQKCGSKVYKKDKYCGKCGKTLLQSEASQTKYPEKTVDDIYKHNLDVVFGYTPSPGTSIRMTEEGAGIFNQTDRSRHEKLERDKDGSQEKSGESLKVRTFNFAKEVFRKPHILIQSKEIYPASLLWLYISTILFISSIMTVNAFDAAFFPMFYFEYLVFYVDLYYLFPAFIWNIVFFIIIYVLSVIINTFLKPEKEYEKLNFRDHVILSSWAMIISTFGAVLIQLNLTWPGILLSRLGIIAYIASPFLLSIFYIMSGRTKISKPMYVTGGLIFIPTVICIIHTSLSIY